MKKLVSILLCLCLALGAAGCKGAGSAEQKYVAVIVKSLNSDFFKNLQNGVDAAATEYNVRVTFEGPEHEEDYAAQNSLIQKAVKNGASAILLSAIDEEKSNLAVQQAVQSGVPVLTVDSDISSPLVRAFIGTNSTSAGAAAAKAAVAALPSGQPVNIGLVNYTEETQNGKLREQGFRSALQQYSNAKIVGSVTAQSSVASARSGAKQLLKEHPEINVLVGFNEWMTLGIGEAAKATIGNAVKAPGGRVHCVGFDTNVQSVAMLETGEMHALIVQNPFAMGYLGVKNAAEQAAEGAGEKQLIYTEVTTVTQNNMFESDVQKLLFRFGS